MSATIVSGEDTPSSSSTRSSFAASRAAAARRAPVSLARCARYAATRRPVTPVAPKTTTSMSRSPTVAEDTDPAIVEGRMIARLGRDHHDRRARDRRWNPGARPSDFASVYPANRAARVARVLHVPGGAAVVVHEEEQVLMAIALRNVGAGLA